MTGVKLTEFAKRSDGVGKLNFELDVENDN